MGSKKKKEEDVKINKAEVAEFVVNQACNHTHFGGMSKIGSYPGRKYSWSSYDLNSLNPQVQRDITNICKHLFKDEDAKAYVVKALAGSGKSKVKRMKRNYVKDVPKFVNQLHSDTKQKVHVL